MQPIFVTQHAMVRARERIHRFSDSFVDDFQVHRILVGMCHGGTRLPFTVKRPGTFLVGVLEWQYQQDLILVMGPSLYGPHVALCTVLTPELLWHRRVAA